MRATQIMITAPREARLVETDVPTDDLRPSEVVVRTRVSLLSGGTEGAFFRGLPLPACIHWGMGPIAERGAGIGG